MDGIAFGKELLRLRKKTEIPSRELSEKVGKNYSYVSQLERGKIKKPDYDTCFQLLKILGEEESSIEGILAGYGFKSPLKEQAELKMVSKQVDNIWDVDWFDRQTQILKSANDRLHDIISTFIDRDISRAEKLVENLTVLAKTKESFDFLISLFEYDYSRITPEDRKKLLNEISGFIEERYGYDEYGDFIRKGGS